MTLKEGGKNVHELVPKEPLEFITTINVTYKTKCPILGKSGQFFKSTTT